MNQFDVLVIGGGVIGLASALSMAQQGFKIGLFDYSALRVPDEDESARAYAINSASQHFLQSLGVWQTLDENNKSPYRAMQVWDARSQGQLYFDASMIHEADLGHILTESTLKRALLNAIHQESKIMLFPNTRIQAIQENASGVTVSDQTSVWQANFLMISDGAQSTARNLLKVPLITWPYHQQAITATVTTEKPHELTAYQVFNPDGPLAFLPLKHQNQCSIVWSTSSDQAKLLSNLSDEAFNEALSIAFMHKLGKVKLATKRQCFPLIMRHVSQYKGKHWLLLGDAAHTIHPLAGLGLNLGLADLQRWLGFLSAENNRITAKALGQYQRNRKTALWQVIMLMEGLKALFLNPLPPVKLLRGLGLNLCNQIMPLKKQFIAYARGLL